MVEGRAEGRGAAVKPFDIFTINREERRRRQHEAKRRYVALAVEGETIHGEPYYFGLLGIGTLITVSRTEVTVIGNDKAL